MTGVQQRAVSHRDEPPGRLGASVGETWAFYLVGSALEAALLLLIIRYAWSWPRRVD